MAFAAVLLSMPMALVASLAFILVNGASIISGLGIYSLTGSLIMLTVLFAADLGQRAR